MLSAILSAAIALAVSAPSAPCRFERLEKTELRIPGGAPGVRLFMMQIPSAQKRRRGAVVLVHGAGSGGSAIWDLRHSDYSVMRRLACEGFDAYSVDLSGFGGSTMPASLRANKDAGPPAVRARDAVKDLEAAVRHALKKSGTARVDLVAWSWGCLVAGWFSGLHPDQVRKLVLFAPVYDRKWPERHKTKGAWRSMNKKDVLKYLDLDREEKEIWVEHIESMYRFNTGPDLRLPNGPYADIYGPDAPIWDPEKIRAEVLVLRGDKDRASLRAPALRLIGDLVNAKEKRYVEVAGGDHFLMRERRYRQFQGIVVEFLTSDPMTKTR